MTRPLHEERLEAVRAAVLECGAASVVDLGCGDGDLLVRLVGDASIRRLAGVDVSRPALARLRQRLAALAPTEVAVDLFHASMTVADRRFAGFDCATLVETIEHLPPADLSRLERALFHAMRPATAILTTPNAEFNPLLGVPAHRFRHPDHRFEWPRARFRGWARRVAAAAGYAVFFRDIAGCHPERGGASQMAIFSAPAIR